MKNTALITIILCLVSAPALGDNFFKALANAAKERTHHRIVYDGSYFSIPYPNGDVPETVGVCTDVVIRAYRKMGIDLQKEVHMDISRDFDAYPSRRIWNLKSPDPNIDHRRVPNLRTFFSRNGVELPISTKGSDYRPGDLVTWMLPGNLPHIGIVSNETTPKRERPMIIHNIGAGPRLEDALFIYKITGHYRYRGPAGMARN